MFWIFRIEMFYLWFVSDFDIRISDLCRWRLGPENFSQRLQHLKS